MSTTTYPAPTAYNFDGTCVMVSAPAEDGRCEFAFTDSADENADLTLHFERCTAPAGIRAAMPGYIRAGTVSRWWADRMHYVATRALNSAR